LRAARAPAPTPGPRVFREGNAIRNLDPVKDVAIIKATNPVEHIANIRVPLFSAYGKNDPRVRFDQWLHPRKPPANNTANNIEIMVGENEGHGFRKIENRLEFYRRVEDFLARNMNAPEGA